MDFIQAYDQFFADMAHQLASGAGSFFTPIFRLITVSGNHGIIFIALSVLLLFFKKTRKMGILCLVTLLIGHILAEYTIKNIVQRARPYTVEDSIYRSYWVAVGSLEMSGYSFPSGHATASMGFACSLFYLTKEKWYLRILYFLIPLTMGFTRIYFMVHYASDVTIGYVVGIVGCILAILIIKLVEKYIIPSFKNRHNKKEAEEISE